MIELSADLRHFVSRVFTGLLCSLHRFPTTLPMKGQDIVSLRLGKLASLLVQAHLYRQPLVSTAYNIQRSLSMEKHGASTKPKTNHEQNAGTAAHVDNVEIHIALVMRLSLLICLSNANIMEHTAMNRVGRHVSLAWVHPRVSVRLHL